MSASGRREDTRGRRPRAVLAVTLSAALALGGVPAPALAEAAEEMAEEAQGRDEGRVPDVPPTTPEAAEGERAEPWPAEAEGQEDPSLPEQADAAGQEDSSQSEQADAAPEALGGAPALAAQSQEAADRYANVALRVKGGPNATSDSVYRGQSGKLEGVADPGSVGVTSLSKTSATLVGPNGSTSARLSIDGYAAHTDTHSGVLSLSSEGEGSSLAYTAELADGQVVRLAHTGSPVRLILAGGEDVPGRELVEFTFCDGHVEAVSCEAREDVSGAISYMGFDVRECQDISSAEVTLGRDEYECTGSEVRPSVSRVTLNGSPLLYLDGSVQYEVSYENNVLPGTGTVVVTGTGRYTGSARKDFRIVGEPPARLDISSATVAVAGWTYDGASHDAAPTVTLGGQTLSPGTDYDISGDASATHVGTYVVTVTGKGAYEGTATGTYEVARRPATVTADDKAKEEGAADPALTATVSGTIGSDRLSYSLSRDAGDAPGTYAIRPSGDAEQGDYRVTYVPGTLTVRAKAPAKTNISSATVAVAGWTYDGASHDAAPTVTLGGRTLSPGTDYDVSGDASAMHVGTYAVTVTGRGAYEGTATSTYSVAPAALTAASVEGGPLPWDGAPKRPAVTGWAGSLRVSDSGYLAAYENNVAPGEATVTVTGRGDFAGTVTATFRIGDAPAGDLAALRAAVEAARGERDLARAAHDAAETGANSKEALDAAQADIDTKQAAYDAATGNDTVSAAAKAAADQEVKDAAAAIEAAQAATGATHEELEAAKAQREVVAAEAAAKQKIATAENALAEVQAARDALATAKSQGEAAVTAAQAKLTQKEAAYAAAQERTAAALATWQAELAGNQEENWDAENYTTANGALGFYKYIGFDYAIGNLTGAKITTPWGTTLTPKSLTTDDFGNTILSYTHIGQDGDATSLVNMRRAVELVKECNEYRELHNQTWGLSPENPTYTAPNGAVYSYCAPLVVNDFLMVGGMMNANWTANNTGGTNGNAIHDHAVNYGSDFGYWENLYMSSSSKSDPFNGWYTQEKAYYEQLADKIAADPSYQGTTADRNNTGHYLMIINPSAYLSGGGVNTAPTNPKNNYKYTYEQYFFKQSDTVEQYAPSMTPDEWLARFDEYVAKVQAHEGTSTVSPAQAAYQQAQAAEAQAKTARDNAQAELNTANANLAQTETQLAAAQKDVDEAAAELQKVKDENPITGITSEEVEANIAAKQSAYDTAVANLNAANARHTKALGDQRTAANSLAAAQQAASDASDALNTATQFKADLEKTLEQLDIANMTPEEIAALRRQTAERLAAAEEALARATAALREATDLSAAEVAPIKGRGYDGRPYEPRPKVTLNGKALVEGADYAVSYRDNVDAGTATVTVTGKGAYTGAKSATFAIGRAEVAVPKATSRTYNGAAQVGVAEGAGYRLSGTARATNAGTYEAIATPDKNHRWADGSTAARALTWKVAPASVAKAALSKIANQPYTGKAITPRPVVKVGGKTLKLNADYTMAYKNNAKAGTATVTVRGKGNYTGSRTATFRVVAPSIRYRTHVQSYGDQSWRKDGQPSGTFGEAKRLEGIWVELPEKPVSGSIQYRTQVQTFGWQGWRNEGQMSGTHGKAKRLEAIQVRLTGQMAQKYDVWYRVHAQTFGWMGWAKNGAKSGTAGLAKRLEAIQIVLLPKGSKAPATNYGGFKQATAAPFRQK